MSTDDTPTLDDATLAEIRARVDWDAPEYGLTVADVLTLLAALEALVDEWENTWHGRRLRDLLAAHPTPSGAPQGEVWPRGELVPHPTPGKAWVKVPHRNDIGSDWIEVDLPDVTLTVRELAAGLRALRGAVNPQQIADAIDSALDDATPSDAPRGECDHPGMGHQPFSYTGICPQCRKCKFIGHGPLCLDCATHATATAGGQHDIYCEGGQCRCSSDVDCANCGDIGVVALPLPDGFAGGRVESPCPLCATGAGE